MRDLRVEPDDELLRRFYDEVLLPSFDADELMDLDSFADGVRSKGDQRYLASVAVDDDGYVLGGIVGVLYETTKVLLLAYLAVRPGLRGRGVGTELVQRVTPEWFDHPGVAIAVGEVHDPRVWAAEETADDRLRLYDRLGGRVLAVPFVQPALGEGERVRGFLLLVFHVDDRVRVVQDGHEAVRADVLARFVRAYFEESEGVEPPYDPELAALLGRIERDGAVPLLPLSEYARVPLLGDT